SASCFRPASSGDQGATVADSTTYVPQEEPAVLFERAVERQRLHVEGGPVNHSGSVGPDQQWRQREAQFVDEPRVVQLAVERGAAFGEHDVGAAPAEGSYGL